MICSECNITPRDDKGWVITKELNLCIECKYNLDNRIRIALQKEMYGEDSSHAMVSWGVDLLN